MKKTLLWVIVFVLATAQTARAALPDASEAVDGILDLQGGTYTVSGDNAIADYSGLEFRNGTITFSGAVNQNLSSGFAGFTVGEGAVVTGGTSSANWYFSADNFNIAVTNGGKFCVAKDLTLGRQGGTSTLLLDGANFEVTGEFGLPICENTSSANDNRDYRCDATITNSTLTLKNKTHVGYILSGVKNKIKSIESNVRVYDSTITAETWQTASGNDKGGVADEDAHMSTYFGHGTIIDVSKFYINRYRRPNASITFDGAIVRRHGTETGLFDQYQYNSANRYVTTGKGLTLDFNDDYTEGSSYAAGISGDGDVIKTGTGTFTLNKGYDQVFTGALVSKGGTFVSSKGFTATAFKAEGGNLTLSGALSAANVALAATDGGTLTLDGATITDTTPSLTLAGGGTTDYFTRDGAVDTYTLDSLTLGSGAVLDLDGNATTVDAINATTTTLTATSANPATININFTAAPAAGATFTFFETDSADKFAVNPKLGSLTLPHEVTLADGVLTLTITADDYTWNGSQTNWGDDGAWTKNDASADWSDGNNAVFGTANAEATLAADASAAEVRFTANATVSGTANLTAPKVNVANGVTGTISAPITGAFEKIGLGTLTLGTNRTDDTILTEGTLALSGTASLDWSKLTFGTNAAKPVTLEFGENATLAGVSDAWNIGNDADRTVTVRKTGGDWSLSGDLVVGAKSGSTATFTLDGGTVTVPSGRWTKSNGGAGTINLNGGILITKHICDDSGSLAVNFNGGTLKANNTDNNGLLYNKKSNLTVTVEANGGTIDNNGKNITINADLQGAGAMAFIGSGKTTIGVLQTGTGAFNVNAGTLVIGSEVGTISRTISVAAGATLSIAALSTETPVATAESFSFASGSTLALPAITAKGKYKLLKLSSGTFASNPLASATISGLTVPYTITAEGDTVYLNIAHDYTVVGNTGVSTLTVTDDTVLFGIGGAKLSELSFGATGKLTLDPIKTPIKVSATPAFAEGAKIALSEDYAGMTLGKVVLMTYSGEATIPEGLFDSSSVSGTATLSQETAPDGTSKQLVLTVGDYENEAKEIRILPVGDSITQGVNCSSQGDYPQYRSTIAARLAANGYKPVMKGVWYKSQNDAAGVQQPDEWRWHSGISAERIMIGGTHGGVRDNMHVYLDIAGDVNAITILIGTNDIGSSDRTAEATYAAYTNLLFATAAQRPNAKIFGSTILDRDDKNDSVRNSIAAFNTYLRTDYEAGRLPANYVMLDLYAALPVAESGNFFDKLHPNWKGDAVIGDAFANAIKTALPLTGEGAISGAPDPTVTDEVQAALGAANIPELADYRFGMTPIFTIDAAATNGFTSAPYTTTNNIVSLNRNVTKVGYYMELVRKGTNRRRYVWVDFDAAGKTLGEVDFPWDGENLDFVAEKLHVYSNDPSIHNVAANDNSVTGVVEGTRRNYTTTDDNGDVPSDVKDDMYGWNDTLQTSGGYGCFQVHRIFNEGEHWNRGEVLFAWNCWGSSKASNVDEIGIGSFAACKTELAGTFSMDYTGTSNSGNGAKDTLNADAYSVRRVEIWAVPVIPAKSQHGKWIGGGGANMSNPANWDDGVVPATDDDLDFSSITSATTINGDIDVTFGAVTMGYNVITFTGSLTATSFSDTSKIAVGENSTVTLDGDLVFSGSSDQYIINTVAAGGRFVVTGKIEASNQMTGGQLFPYVSAGSGAVQAKGLVANEGTSDLWTFRLSSGSNGTANWIVGENGLSGSKYFFEMNESKRKAAIQPLDSDFTIATQVGVRAPLTLNTTGYDGNPHTITIGDGEGNGGIIRDGAVTIAGSGKVVANYDATNLHANHTNPFTVTDTATLALMSGSNLGTGTITLGAGTTLAVVSTDGSAFTTLSNVVLPTGENEKATIQIDGKRLKTKEHTILEDVREDAADHLTVTGTALDGRKVELKTVLAEAEEPEKYNLVLTPIPNGFTIIIR